MIKVGNTTFAEHTLKGIKLTEAYARFEYLDKRIVKKAHEIANPKRRKKTSKK